MRRRPAVMVCCLIFSSLLAAQDYKRADFFGGYSYLNIDTNGLSDRQSANGWETSTSVNVNKWLAAEGDISGYYKNFKIGFGDVGIANVHVTDSGFVFGPRVNFRPAFFHVLLGVDHLTGSASGVSDSQNSFAGAFGGGAQVKVAPDWAVRVSGDYVMTHHNIFGGQSFTQNNFRVAVGVVYSFGSVGARRAALPQTKSPEEQPESQGFRIYNQPDKDKKK